jgi:tetratricopeptide (TPR) repeat protein
MAQQKFPKAYEAYQQAVYRDGRNPTFWCSIGVLYYQINQYRDALDAYSRAIRLNPYISEVWYDLGTLVSRNLVDLLQSFQLTTISMNPATTKPMMHLMHIHEPPSLTQQTFISKHVCNCCAVDKPLDLINTMLLFHKMFTRKHIRMVSVSLLDHNGALLLPRLFHLSTLNPHRAVLQTGREILPRFRIHHNNHLRPTLTTRGIR